MKYIFEAGDKVIKKDGHNFSNGSRWVTVEQISFSTAWFVETQTNLGFDSLLPYHEVEQQLILEKLQEHRDELQAKSNQLKSQLESNDEALLQANLAIQLVKGLS